MAQAIAQMWFGSILVLGGGSPLLHFQFLGKTQQNRSQ
jgi:hypothetical protein